MSDPSEMSEEKKYYLTQARALVENIEQGNDSEVNSLIESISKFHESMLFQEVGKLTRQLHETLNNFHVDTRVEALTKNEIPDAKERLNYVIKMTEDSANRTLSAVEAGLPIAEELKDKSNILNKKWRRFRQREMPVEEFRELSNEIDSYLSWSVIQSEKIRENFSHILMAQDFQDLTGQVIRRVINLVQEMEGNLVDMVRISGQRMKKEPLEENVGSDSKLDGPRIPGCDSHKDRLSSQDDVDDLLSSIGF